MKKFVLTAVVALVIHGVFIHRSNAADNPVLAEMYGRGVHAYYAGDTINAERYLTMAIHNGIKDPRAYYFRGMVAYCMGNIDQAKGDWQQGAQMEAEGNVNPLIGRSLARFQGMARIELEEIRQTARLQAVATGAARSEQRYDELRAAEPSGLGAAPIAPPPAAAAPPAAATPAPAPENPFAEGGTPEVTADDALDGAMSDPFADDPAPAGGAPAGGDDSNPFGGGGADTDPFGGGGAESDPFGGGGDAGGAMEDPFGGGGDPFGN